MNVNSEINYCLGLSFYSLQNYAGENYKKVYDYMSANYDGEKVNTLLIGSIFTCIASDGKLSDSEWNFIASFIGGYSYDEAFEVAGEFYNDEAQRIVRELLGMFQREIAEAFVKLCVAVLCVDKKIDGKEADFLENILD